MHSSKNAGLHTRSHVTARQTGVALLVALVALLILTVVGLVAAGDLIIQSGTIRNEQFRQRVFYAVASEVSATINVVNQNSVDDDDPLIIDLLDNRVGSTSFQLSSNPITVSPTTVQMDDVEITASRNNLLGCLGESIGRVNVLSGAIEATARLDDGKINRGIRSTQRQRFVYCWP